jgi:hypothetical protein
MAPNNTKSSLIKDDWYLMLRGVSSISNLVCYSDISFLTLTLSNIS